MREELIKDVEHAHDYQQEVKDVPIVSKVWIWSYDEALRHNLQQELYNIEDSEVELVVIGLFKWFLFLV